MSWQALTKTKKQRPKTTECVPDQLKSHALGLREVLCRFNRGRISSDGNGTLRWETDVRLGVLQRLADCFTDYRNPLSVEHDLLTLVIQRVYGLALDYEDLNDQDALRADSLLAMLVGKSDLTDAQRVRDQDKGLTLASSSTLNRLELSTPDTAATNRYKLIAGDAEAMDRLLAALLISPEHFDRVLRINRRLRPIGSGLCASSRHGDSAGDLLRPCARKGKEKRAVRGVAGDESRGCAGGCVGPNVTADGSLAHQDTNFVSGRPSRATPTLLAQGPDAGSRHRTPLPHSQRPGIHQVGQRVSAESQKEPTSPCHP